MDQGKIGIVLISPFCESKGKILQPDAQRM
jgi:hypothetical protein